MSREVPLLASEKIKLGCLSVFVLLLVAGLLSGSWRKIYRAIVRDKKGYEQSMEALAGKAYFEVSDFDAGINRYKLEVKPEAWSSWDNDQKFEYCDNCFNAIRKAQQTYKMYDEDNEPLIEFYVNNKRVAYVGNGYTHVND